MLWYLFVDSTSFLRLRSIEFMVNSKLRMLLTGGWWMKHALLKNTSRKKIILKSTYSNLGSLKGILRDIRKRKSALFLRRSWECVKKLHFSCFFTANFKNAKLIYARLLKIICLSVMAYRVKWSLVEEYNSNDSHFSL